MPVLLAGDLVAVGDAVKERAKYGYEKTIHGSTQLDVEVDEQTGEVVAVWFRCAMLPFRVSKSDPERAADMRRAYAEQTSPPELLAVDIEYDTGPKA